MPTRTVSSPAIETAGAPYCIDNANSRYDMAYDARFLIYLQCARNATRCSGFLFWAPETKPDNSPMLESQD